ncbi:hypothetical protein GCM10025857_11160 [Alicyclobacillus contaminans]|nr:hypothetical protein GCM10025857_11160 [Alicyclobacillus contaminans]
MGTPGGGYALRGVDEGVADQSDRDVPDVAGGGPVHDAKRRGKIINIASVAGLRGSDERVLDAVGYSASKGGVISLTRDLAIKWAKHNIYVNAIAPGFFPTKMTKGVLEHAEREIVNNTPLRRIGGERDLQGAALYFASAASDYTTGQVLAVDGGTTAR